MVISEGVIAREHCGVMREFSGESRPGLREKRPRGPATSKRAVWKLLFAIPLLMAPMAASAARQEAAATPWKSAAEFHQRGDYAHSIPILKRLVQASPRDYDANLLLGEDLFLSGSAQEALVPLRVASDERPADGTAEAYLAEAAASLGDFSTAAEAFESAVSRSGEALQFQVEWADFSLDRSQALVKSLRSTKRGAATMLRVTASGRPEDNETRESLLEQSAAAAPEQDGIWGELGSVQVALGRYSEAQESLKQAELRQPHDSETLRLEALFAAMEQRWSDAEGKLSVLGARSPAGLRRVLALWPPLLIPGPEVAGPAWDCLRKGGSACPLASAAPRGGEGLHARDLYAEGRWEQLLTLPASAAPSSFDSLWRGVALVATGDCPRAIPLLERGLKADEQAAGFRLQLCYAEAGERVLARLKTSGDEAALHQLKGDMLLRLQNDPAAAQLEFAQALSSRPRDPHLLARLADAYRRLGEEAEARQAAQDAVVLDAHESSALHTLALMAMNERDYAEAIARLKQIAAMDPLEQWTQVQLGVAYGQLGHPEETLRYLGPQLAAGYSDPKGALHAMLANALRKLGRAEEAKQAAQEAARLAEASMENNGNRDANSPQ